MNVEPQLKCKSSDNDENEFYFQWHLTDKCNLKCVHCYQNDTSNSSELMLEELKAIADEIDLTLSRWKKDGRVAVTGGEPFVRKDVIDLLTYLEQLPHIKKLGILTNGTLIKQNIEFLKRLTKLHYVQLSLEGRKEINDGIRGNGTFDTVIESTGILVASGIPTRWMVTLHKKNVSEVPFIIDLALENGVSTLTFERLVPMGSGESFTDYVLSPEELKEIFEHIVKRSDEEYSKGSGLTVLKLRTLWVLVDPERADKDLATPIEQAVGACCSIGMDSLCILPDATVLPCRRLPIPIGNLKNDSLFKIWYTSKVLWDIRDKRNLKGKCNGCEYIPRCGGCRATAYALTGDYLAEDPQCWKKTV